jgi:hypothetical protein
MKEILIQLGEMNGKLDGIDKTVTALYTDINGNGKVGLKEQVRSNSEFLQGCKDRNKDKKDWWKWAIRFLTATSYTAIIGALIKYLTM